MVKYVRNGLIEQWHYGFVMLADKIKPFDFKGDDNNYPFYLRSCAKPLQASLIIDYGLDKYYDMTSAEIALCCSSHAGEDIHTETAKNLLKKIGLDKKYLKCGFHKPLSQTVQKKLILDNKKENIFHNNCSGKHIMMLAACKIKNWDLTDYDNPVHPLQQEIKKKIYDLCNIGKNSPQYPMTKDGCGVPIYSMPLRNMLKGYLNLFCNPVYEKITSAFIDNPYIIGGEGRLDTKIMQNSKNLVAKSGAGGLCIVVNIEEEKALVVKICDSDMKARETVILDILKNLHWANIENPKDILTLHNEKVGEILTCI